MRPPAFDEESWEALPSFFGELPEPVLLRLWADEAGAASEREAIRLVQTLGKRFDKLSHEIRSRKPGYDYYPVVGVFGSGELEPQDYGLRFIGLPAGYQMTSLVAAIQCVSFKGMTSEAQTRIRLSRLAADVRLELITSADDELGALMAQRIFNMAVSSKHVRSFLIMGDAFPQSLIRYSVNRFPHLVVNGRIHVEGPLSEDAIVRQIANALK